MVARCHPVKARCTGCGPSGTAAATAFSFACTTADYHEAMRTPMKNSLARGDQVSVLRGSDCLHGSERIVRILLARSFSNRHNPIHSGHGHLLNFAVGPVNFDCVYCRRLAETEVRAWVAG